MKVDIYGQVPNRFQSVTVQVGMHRNRHEKTPSFAGFTMRFPAEQKLTVKKVRDSVRSVIAKHGLSL